MENKQNTKFVFGIVGLAIAALAFCFFWFPYVGLIISVVALILSIIGIGASRLKGFGIAGTIVSAIALGLSLLFTFVITAAFIKRGDSLKASEAEKKAQTVYTASKQVLLQASSMGGTTYDGVKVSNDGGTTYFITVSDLVKLGELDKNPFKSSAADGGMTVYYTPGSNSYNVTITGTISDYTITYLGYGLFLATE